MWRVRAVRTLGAPALRHFGTGSHAPLLATAADQSLRHALMGGPLLNAGAARSWGGEGIRAFAAAVKAPPGGPTPSAPGAPGAPPGPGGPPGPRPGPGAPGAGMPLAVEVTHPSQVQEVLQASMAIPVLIDCYAAWCQPCKTLTPLLEKHVNAAGGKLLLAKVDVDRPELAKLVSTLQVKSLPTVIVVYQGDVKDTLVGNPAPAALEAFLAKAEALVGGAVGAAAEGAPDVEKLLEEGYKMLDAAGGGGEEAPSPAAIAPVFAKCLAPDAHTSPSNKARALAGLARVALLENHLDVARELVTRAREEGGNELAPPEVAMAAARVDMAEAAGGGGADVAQLRARIGADAGDIDARHDLAGALFAAGDAGGAMEQALALVRAKDVDRGRALCVQFFDALGHAHPETVKGRRALSNLLFV